MPGGDVVENADTRDDDEYRAGHVTGVTPALPEHPDPASRESHHTGG